MHKAPSASAELEGSKLVHFPGTGKKKGTPTSEPLEILRAPGKRRRPRMQQQKKKVSEFPGSRAHNAGRPAALRNSPAAEPQSRRPAPHTWQQRRRAPTRTYPAGGRAALHAAANGFMLAAKNPEQRRLTLIRRVYSSSGSGALAQVPLIMRLVIYLRRMHRPARALVNALRAARPAPALIEITSYIKCPLCSLCARALRGFAIRSFGRVSRVARVRLLWPFGPC